MSRMTILFGTIAGIFLVSVASSSELTGCTTNNVTLVMGTVVPNTWSDDCWPDDCEAPSPRKYSDSA